MNERRKGQLDDFKKVGISLLESVPRTPYNDYTNIIASWEWTMIQQQFSSRLVFLVLGGLILMALAFSSVSEAQAGRPVPSPAVEITEALTNTPSFTPTSTATEIPSIVCDSANLGGVCQQINSTTIGGSYQWEGDTNNWYNNSGTFARFSMAAVSQSTTVYVTWWESTVGMNSYYGVDRVFDVYNAKNSAQLEKIADDVLLPGNGSSSYSQTGPKYYTLTITSGNGLYLFNQANRSGSVGSYEGHGTFTVYVSTSGFYDPTTPTSTATLTSTPTNTPTPIPTTPPPSSNYDRVAAVYYADQWAHEPRPTNYPNYGVDTDGDDCDDCTNYLSQVLEAGGIPQIPGDDDIFHWFTYQNFWGIWQGSKSWAATDWFNNHAHQFQGTRYEFYPNGPETLSPGDFFLMDLATNPFAGPDHARVVVGMGTVLEGDAIGEWRLLVNQHCIDRKRVYWLYNLPAGTQIWPWHVEY